MAARSVHNAKKASFSSLQCANRSIKFIAGKGRRCSVRKIKHDGENTMIRGQLPEIREESRAIIEYLEECLAAARDLDASIARTPAAQAGERLVNEAMLRELNDRMKKGAA